MLIDDIAKMISAEIIIPKNCKNSAPDIQGVAALDKAGAGHISFLVNPLYAKQALSTEAGAVIVKSVMEGSQTVQLVHPHPYWAFAKVSQHFFRSDFGPVGVSDQAVVDPTAKIGENARIFAQVFIGKNVDIGDDVTILPGTYIGDESRVGAKSVIHANASICSGTSIGERCIIHAGVVLGGDGFGFAPLPPSTHSSGDIAKIPQIGNVVLEDDVEIGSGTTIDRAALGETRIGACSKLDSQVHIGHNAQIGHHTMIAGQCAIAGSAKIGNWVVLGGQVGVAGHVTIGDGVIIGAKAGVTKNISDTSEPYMGFPAVPASQWRRQIASIRRMLDTLKLNLKSKR